MKLLLIRLSFATLFFYFFSPALFAQNTPQPGGVKIKINADVNGKSLNIDTTVDALSNFNFQDLLNQLGLGDEVNQLNIEIQNGLSMNMAAPMADTDMAELAEEMAHMHIEAVPPMPAMAGDSGMQAFSFSYNNNKAFLGVETDKVPGGAKISKVTDGSAALAAGLKEGDIITKIDDRTVESPDNLSEIIGLYNPNDKVIVTYERDGKTSTASATLKENKDYFDMSKMDSLKSINWDSQGMDMSNKGFLGVYLDDTDNKVVITGIISKSAAEEAGLQKGDIIKSIDGKNTSSYNDVQSAISSKKPGDKVTIIYERDGKQLQATPTLKKEGDSFMNMNWSDSDSSHDQGYVPNPVIQKVRACPQNGCSFAYSSSGSSGSKNVTIYVTVVNKSETTPAATEEKTSSSTQQPLLNPDNVQVYSNPSDGTFKLHFELPDAGDTQISVTGMNGKTIYSESLNNFSGVYDKTISLGTTSKGTYFVKVAQNGYSATKTLIVQ